MAKIDDLVIQIKADTKQLQAQLNQIEGKLKVTGRAGNMAFGAAGGGMAAGMAKARVGALALVGGLLAVGKSVSSIAKVGAGFEDLKDSLDQVFGSVQAGDAAMNQVFQFAQTTPFQIETATKAFIALKSAGIEPSMDMLQTFADTASVSVDQLGTFEALIRVVQRSAGGGLGLEELNMIADRGIDVFGGLKEELGKGRDEIAEFGKTAEGAKAITDALVKTLDKSFGGAMASKMDNLSTKTSNMVIAFKQLADEVFKSGLGDILKGLTDRLTEFATAAGRAVRVASGRATEEDILTEIGILEGQIDNSINAQNMLGLEADPDDRNFLTKLLFGDKSVEEMRAQVKAFENMLERIRAAKAREAKEGGKKEGGKTVAFDASSVEGLIDFQAEFKKLVEDSVPETVKLGNQIEYIQSLMATADKAKLKGIMAFLGVESVDEMQVIVDHLQKLQDELDETATFSSEMQTAIISASQAFTSDFVQSLMDGENALDSFKNFAKNIVNQIITIFLQMAVVNEILNNVFNLTGTNNALPTFSNTKKGAGGSSAYQGQAMIVGERGPELFVPHSNGNILNNMNTKNAMGGAPIIVNQSVNFATGVVPTVRAEVVKMMPQIADVTKGAVAEAAMRGGNFRRALQGG
tara:strand:+ start:3656 stop:5566 length:1911 start_codon:yes stop_codon:yes gene_type:complete